MMIFLFYVILFLLVWWVFRDAQARGLSPLFSGLWAVAVFFVWFIALPLWFFVRPKNKLNLID